MIPWWGWLIIAVVAMIGVYYVVALVFFSKVSKRVFKTHDEIARRFPADRDPFDDEFFKRPLNPPDVPPMPKFRR